MPSQHIRDQSEEIALEGIVVPLDLPEFHVVTQEWHVDGSLRVRVIAINDTAVCPRCQMQCNQLHDCRERARAFQFSFISVWWLASPAHFRVYMQVLRARPAKPAYKLPVSAAGAKSLENWKAL